MKKIVCVLLVVVLLFAGCSSSPSDKIDPSYYQVGKDALGIAQAYLSDKITLAEAKEKASQVLEQVEALQLIPEKDPTYEQSDLVKLYADTICLSFSLQDSETRTLQLNEDLEKYSSRLEELLGLK